MSTEQQENNNAKTLGIRVSNCLLETSMFVVVGLGIGTALSIQKKNLRPFVMGCTIGNYISRSFFFLLLSYLLLILSIF
jgi:hypothetical protein